MISRSFAVPSCVVALAWVLSLPASAQTPADPPATTPTRRTTLDVVAAHKSQPPVGDLAASAFTLFDNKTPRPISSFKAFRGDQTPVSVILVIDAVNANFSGVSQERDQIERFLKAHEGHLAHPTTLAIFTDSGLVIQPTFTRDGNALAASLEKQSIGLRDIRRSSGFWGADERMQLSLNTLSQLAQAESRVPDRKLVLWISPGWPLLSGPGVELDTKQAQGIFGEVVKISAQLRQARITLYALNPAGAAESLGRSLGYEEYVKGISKPGEAEFGDLALQTLAVQSGGQAFSGSNDISSMIQSAYEDGSAYYELTFDPAPAEHPDEYHRVEVKVSQPDLTVRTRQGYYNQP